MQGISHRIFRHHMMRNINLNNLGNLIGRRNRRKSHSQPESLPFMQFITFT